MGAITLASIISILRIGIPNKQNCVNLSAILTHELILNDHLVLQNEGR
jgi:hypothetical protein